MSWQPSRCGKGGYWLVRVNHMCTCTSHLDFKASSSKRNRRGGGLQHISGIFQLMMCGCGSTGEREPLTVLSLFCVPRAPCCIPVRCAYFGSSLTAPRFTVYSLHFSFLCPCSSLALSQSIPQASLSPWTFSPPHLIFLLNFLLYFLSWSGQSDYRRLWNFFLFFAEQKKGSERKSEGGMK